MSKRVAILSCADLVDPNNENTLLSQAMSTRGIHPEILIWDQQIDWKKYDCAIIRTTWDYTQKLERFCETLFEVESQGCRLFNPSEVVLWNINKSYLVELATKGILTPPTVWCEGFDSAQLSNFGEEIGAEKFIVKPAVGAGGASVFKVENVARFKKDRNQMRALNQELQGKEVLIQPFLESIITEGEYSFHFFGGEFSHAVVKRAKPGEFLVQEKHGGTTAPYAPNSIELSQASLPLQHIPGDWLYARVDMVRGDLGNLWLMELELIEPSLFFQHSGRHDAAEMLTRALESKLKF